MNAFKITPLLLAVLCLFSSCKQELSVLNVQIDAEAEGSPWNVDQLFSTTGSDQVKIDKIKFYVSNVSLRNEDGDEVENGEIYLIDLAEGENQFTISDFEAGNYDRLCFSIGVPADLNLQDPAQYESSHPLSIRQDMHWSWSVGYVFAKIEGDWDSTGTGNFEKPILYHTGLQELYEEVCFDAAGLALSDESPKSIRLTLDVPSLFVSDSDSLNLSTENFSHTSPVGSKAFEISKKVTRQLTQEALKLESIQ